MTTEIVEADSPVTILPASEQMDDAAKLNRLHKILKTAGFYAKVAAIEAGVILLRLKKEKAGFFCEWVEANCLFSYDTASRYIQLVAGSFDKKLLVDLITGTEDFIHQTAVEFADTNPKCLTDLYHDFGIVGKSKLGGKRERAGRKKRSEEAREELAAAAEDIQAGLSVADLQRKVDEIYVMVVTMGVAGGMENYDLNEMLTLLEKCLKVINDIRKTRARK